MTLLHREGVIRTVAVLSGLYLAYYIWWRATATLNVEALGFSLLLLAAEVHGFLSFVLFAFMTWDVKRKPPFQHQSGLKVDVYVPTYDEGLDILEATLTGCNAITYPHTTYVLDDGCRAEVKALALRMGCRYLTRPDNRHAKAGNLNAALPRTEGDFIVILDADMIPQPDFLDKTLGYFVDERVALVQLPQEFYNLDSVQHIVDERELAPWHEQALFYQVIQAGKNRWNAAFWCGSPSIVRRTALESVGGVATETVTEDIHTSIRLHARGWKTVYHNEVLAYGIAPQTFDAFAVQRGRWAQGAMQLLRSRENPLVVPGLSLAQRLNYFASTYTYFDGYQKLFYLLAPPVILLTGVLPLRVGAIDFLLHWVPYFLLGALANSALGRGYYRYLRIERYNLLNMFTFIWASFTLVRPRGIRFRVTPKEVDQTVYAQERRRIRPHLALLVTSLLAVALGIGNLVWQLTTAYTRTDIVAITLLWAFANVAVLAIGIQEVLRRRHERRHYRFPVQVPALVRDDRGVAVAVKVEDLSQYGVGLIAPDVAVLGQTIFLQLELPNGSLTLRGEIVHRQALPNGQRRLNVRFLPLEPAEREPLTAFLFVTAVHQQWARRNEPASAVSQAQPARPLPRVG